MIKVAGHYVKDIYVGDKARLFRRESASPPTKQHVTEPKWASADTYTPDDSRNHSQRLIVTVSKPIFSFLDNPEAWTTLEPGLLPERRYRTVKVAYRPETATASRKSNVYHLSLDLFPPFHLLFCQKLRENSWRKRRQSKRENIAVHKERVSGAA